MKLSITYAELQDYVADHFHKTVNVGYVDGDTMSVSVPIKVLGFTDGESANYVYRENMILSVIGIMLGLIIGVFLSSYIVGSIEMDIVMFERKVNAISFIYATAFTLVFSILVNIFMYRKINNISMVESLKSIE